MASTVLPGAARPIVAFGPEMPGWGSWEYLGRDLIQELCPYYTTLSFQGDVVPDCDVAVVVKHLAACACLDDPSSRCRVIYLPVDYFDSCRAIDGEGRILRKCDRVLVHCHRLTHYFRPYALTEFLDHPIKHFAPLAQTSERQKHVVWIGARSNLEPVAEWVNRHELPGELWVLTNFEYPDDPPAPEDFGFRPGAVARMENWSPARQQEWLTSARLALDIKGRDFRSHHKPPTKAMEFLASGVPLAMNAESSPVEHLADMGFEIAGPDDLERWQSVEYREETQRFGNAIRELCSLERVGRRLRRIIDKVLAERSVRPPHCESSYLYRAPKAEEAPSC